MMQKGYENRFQIEMISIEDLVPQEHLLRQISAAVDFSKIYEFVKELYCDDNGRPSIDPVVLFKMVLIQHLYGLPSLQRTADEVSLNIAYRWFLGYRTLECGNRINDNILQRAYSVSIQGWNRNQMVYCIENPTEEPSGKSVGVVFLKS